MPYTQDDLERVIRNALSKHVANGNPPVSQEGVDAIRAWAGKNQDRINAAIERGIKEPEFTSRLTSIVQNAEKPISATSVGASGMTTALDAKIGGCNC